MLGTESTKSMKQHGSVQDRTEPPTRIDHLAGSFLWSVGSSLSTCPRYWSRRRDQWLAGFWKQEGNDLLAGAVSTLIAKIVATSWYVEGPLSVALAYRDILLNQIGFGAGWDEEVTKWVESYLCTDLGGPLERWRTSPTDRTGPALGFAYLDALKCIPTGDPEFPLVYESKDGLRKLHRANVGRIVDSPSGRETDLGVGFCSVSRAVATALIMMEIVRYKRERLSDLPPAGILFINNMIDTQWQDIIKQYDVRQRNQGNQTWRDLLVAFGIDAAHPLTADLFELSSLPEHYDEKVATEMAIYTFALAFRVDPREYWPVSAGPLGTATEAEIQHRKAKGKGEGIIFSAIERQLNSPYSLPRGVHFGFDFRDAEEDKLAADIAGIKITNIRRMWEPHPSAPAEHPGMITNEEARIMLARQNLIPPEFVSGLNVETERVYDSRLYGPTVRAYRDGRVLRYGR